jgi:glycosyltransferase involved in cell wall biosynthesis
MTALRLLVPGPLGQRTGGYRYDRRLVETLRARGYPARAEPLEGRFPDADAAARASLGERLAADAGAVTVVDHLAAVALAQLERRRLPDPLPLVLVHHPFADDPDLGAEERARLARAEQDALARSRGVIATSRFTARRLAELGVDERMIRVVTPGVDPAPVARGRKDGPVRLLCVAAVTPRKGHDVLVDALAQLADRAWRCQCAGDRRRAPEWARALDARAAGHGIAGRIEWLGELDERRLEAAWQEADLLVLPSHYEGYGMAVAEALVRGLPAVTTTGGALAETLPDGCGWQVPPGDPEALAAALAEAIDRPGRRASRARAARRAGAALPGWDRQAERFAAALEALGAGLAGASAAVDR